MVSSYHEKNEQLEDVPNFVLVAFPHSFYLTYQSAKVHNIDEIYVHTSHLM